MAHRLKTNQEMIEQHLEEIGASEFEWRAALASLRVVRSFRAYRPAEQRSLFVEMAR